MDNTATKAFLSSEGKTEYQGFEVCYYTYTMENKPKKFHVNVNVSLKHDQNDYIISLALDKSFASENEAIKYGITQGEKFIEQAIKDGKVRTGS